MSEWFPLPIFPDTLSASVTTTVWIGVLVVAFFNLRLGWTLSGLVVPGYLVPLLLIKPVSAAVIVVEAVISYAIVYLMSEKADHRWPWCSFFGRDRFFALVLVSVLVRAVMDGWLLPWCGAQVNEHWGLDFDYQNNLYSFGLIVVALLANYIWKPGVLGGLFTMGVNTLVTFVLVRYVLMDWTNFNIGSVQYIYEDIAMSLLSSPKTYVILIVTCFIASWMNLYYSWEFNGILVPALLSLLWHDMPKIAFTFLEAGVVYVVAIQVIKSPWMKRTTVEGARKTCVFFSVAFAYRMLLGHVGQWLAPDFDIGDTYGFGFLISSLMASKAYDKNFVIQLTRGTLSVSMMGSVYGSLLAFALSFIPAIWLYSNVTDVPPTQSVVFSDDEGAQIMLRDKPLLYRKHLPDSFVLPNARQLEMFRHGVETLVAMPVGQRDRNATFDEAKSYLFEAGYDLHLLRDRYAYIRERKPGNGWGLYLIDLQQNGSVTIEVPRPLEEWSAFEGGLELFSRLNASSFAVSGAPSQLNRDGEANVLVTSHTIFGAFHRTASRENVVQVRARPNSDDQSRLFVTGSVPSGLNLRQLEDDIGRFKIEWQASKETNVLRRDSWTGFAELSLSEAAGKALVMREIEELQGSLAEWLLSQKERLAEKNSDTYQLADQADLLFLDREVIAPIIDALQTSVSAKNLLAAGGRIFTAATAAQACGYQLSVFRDQSTGREFLVLHEPNEKNRRNWGTFVFEIGLPDAHVIEVPRPAVESNVWEYGVSLFQRRCGSVLLLAGAHPRANRDGTADITRSSNRVNFFQLVHQAVLRELTARQMLVVQIRAFSEQVEADVVLTCANGANSIGQSSPAVRDFVNLLGSDETKLQFVDGSPQTAGYETSSTVQAAMLGITNNKELVSVWLSPALRSRYVQQDGETLQDAQFHALGIEQLECDVAEFISSHVSEELTDGVDSFEAKQKALMEDYLRLGDIVALSQWHSRLSDVRVARLIDRETRQAFLFVGKTETHYVIRLADPGEAIAEVIFDDLRDESQVRSFLRSSATWLHHRLNSNPEQD